MGCTAVEFIGSVPALGNAVADRVFGHTVTVLATELIGGAT